MKARKVYIFQELILDGIFFLVLTDIFFFHLFMTHNDLFIIIYL